MGEIDPEKQFIPVNFWTKFLNYEKCNVRILQDFVPLASFTHMDIFARTKAIHSCFVYDSWTSS